MQRCAEACAPAQVGIEHLVVFLNKCDMVDDEELIELVEMEVRELLDFYKFDGTETPVIQVQSTVLRRACWRIAVCHSRVRTPWPCPSCPGVLVGRDRRCKR